MKELVVKVLVRGIPNDVSAHDVALDSYKAIIAALREKYAIMGYSWEGEEIYRDDQVVLDVVKFVVEGEAECGRS